MIFKRQEEVANSWHQKRNGEVAVVVCRDLPELVGNRSEKDREREIWDILATMNRRDLLRSAAGCVGALAFPLPLLPLNPAPIKITEAKFLRLRYPGKMPVKRNGTITSGGGAPGMTQLELHTDAGIIGRSIAGGNHEIITQQLMPRIVGMNPFHIEAIWEPDVPLQPLHRVFRCCR